MAEMPWRAGHPLPQLAEAGSPAESCLRPCWSRDICLNGAAAPTMGQPEAQLATSALNDCLQEIRVAAASAD